MASSTYAFSKLPRCKFCFDAKELQTDAINLANYRAICRACLKHTTQCKCSKQNDHVISAKGANGHVISAKGAVDYGIEFENDYDITCTNDKPPQRGGAVPFPALGRVEMACQFPEGLILGRFSLGQLFSFFIPAVQCAVTCGQHF